MVGVIVGSRKGEGGSGVHGRCPIRPWPSRTTRGMALLGGVAAESLRDRGRRSASRAANPVRRCLPAAGAAV